MPETRRRSAVVRLERVREAPAGGASTTHRGPSYCPRCGASLEGPRSLVQEYWVAGETVFHCWCRACSFTGDVVEVERIVTHEAAD